MPTYRYEEILPDGSGGAVHEFIQRMSDAPLERHPKTGHPIRRLFSAPNLPRRYSEGATRKKLSKDNLETHGFTRYERDKLTGQYHKTAGVDDRAPSTIDPTRLKAAED